MVAAYHSLVGLAACVTSIANIMLAADGAHGDLDGVHMTTAFLGDVIGAITLTGSVRNPRASPELHGWHTAPCTVCAALPTTLAPAVVELMLIWLPRPPPPPPPGRCLWQAPGHPGLQAAAAARQELHQLVGVCEGGGGWPLFARGRGRKTFLLRVCGRCLHLAGSCAYVLRARRRAGG